MCRRRPAKGSLAPQSSKGLGGARDRNSHAGATVRARSAGVIGETRSTSFSGEAEKGYVPALAVSPSGTRWSIGGALLGRLVDVSRSHERGGRHRHRTRCVDYQRECGRTRLIRKITNCEHVGLTERVVHTVQTPTDGLDGRRRGLLSLRAAFFQESGYTGDRRVRVGSQVPPNERGH